jgi:pimeloyl-ACP methyl ester carboxylesterase
MKRAIYLHGFASGPASRKARFFREQLEQAGYLVSVPDLAAGEFERLTVTRQLAVIENEAGTEADLILGSSLGGYLAALYASTHPAIQGVVLIAPAFGFARRWRERMGEAAMDTWRESGFLEVHHYAENRPARVGYGLIEDGLTHPEEPAFSQPGLLFHGRQDEVCPYSVSVGYAAKHPNVCLQLFEAGHEMTEVMPEMWAAVQRRFKL